VTTDGVTWSNNDQAGAMGATSGPPNLQGVAYYDFNPNCSNPAYSVGEQKWNVTFAGDTAYLTNSSVNYTIYINSTLFNYLVKPNGEVFAEGDTVFIEGNVSDECGSVSSADITFRVRPDELSCTPVSNPNDGNYTCSLDTTALGVGWRNITMNSSKSYYFNGSYLKEDAFQLRTSPTVSSEQVNPSTEGWGFNFTFSVDVQDTDSQDLVNISLWKSVGGGVWEYVGSTNCTSGECTGAKTKYVYSPFDCGDYLNGPNVTFKFNATDSYGLVDETSNFTATLQKDNVSFTVNEGSNEIINRESGTQIFNVTVKDSDRLGAPLVSVTEEGREINGTFKFGITAQTEAFDEGHLAQITQQNGEMNYTLDPNCTYEAGIQYWYAEIHDSQCYADTSMDSTGQIYYVYGQLKNNLTQPINGSEWNVTDQIVANFTTLSDCSDDIPSENPVTGADDYKIELSLDGSSWEQCSAEDSGDGWYNCTWDSTNQTEGWWDIRVNSSEQYFYDNSTTYTDRFWIENKNTTTDNQTIWVYNSTSEWDNLTYEAGWTRIYNYT